jgi:hypothetical protein
MDKEAERKMHREHYEKYERMSRECGIRVTVKDGKTVFGTVDHLRKLYEADHLLNNIPLLVFDGFHGHHRQIKSEFRPRSLADTTCVLKHSIIYHVLGIQPPD